MSSGPTKLTTVQGGVPTDRGAVPVFAAALPLTKLVVPGVGEDFVQNHIAGRAPGDVLTTGTVTPTGGMTARSLPDVLADRINVKSFGAKGLGAASSTQDTLAFERAFAFADTKARVDIYVPSGEYIIKAAADGAVGYLAAVVGKDNFSFSGDGPGSTIIRLANGANRSLMAINSCRNVFIGNYTFDGNSANQTIYGTHGVKFNNVNNVWCDRLHFYNVPGYGLGFQNDYETDDSFRQLFLTNIIIDTTTNDCVDIKNRNSNNRNIMIDNCFFRNPAVDKPCLDIRGQALISNVSMELARVGSIGIRLRSDSDDELGTGTGNIGARLTSVSNFRVCGFGVVQTYGVIVSCENARISGGDVSGCTEVGVWLSGTQAIRTQVSDVLVDGNPYTPLPTDAVPNPVPIAGSKTNYDFLIAGVDASLVDCRALGGLVGFTTQASGAKLLLARTDGCDTGFFSGTDRVVFTACGAKNSVTAGYLAGNATDTFVNCEGFGTANDGVTADRLRPAAYITLPAHEGDLNRNSFLTTWSRGTSIVNPSSGAYTADGYKVVRNGGGTNFTVSQQAHVGADRILTAGQFFLRASITAIGSASRIGFQVSLEDLSRFAGRTVSIATLVRASRAGVQAFPSVLTFNAGSGGSGAPSDPGATPQTLAANTWTPLVRTLTLDGLAAATLGTGNALQNEVRFLALGDGDLIDIGYLIIEHGAGVSALYPRPAAEDAIRNQRFYVSRTVQSQNGSRYIPFPVTMRAVPAVTVTAGTASAITTDGFELTHTAAVAVTYTASAEIA